MSDPAVASRWRALVIVPTYNEIDTLASTVAAVLASAAPVDVLVVDDASPDGTGALADRLAAADHRVHVLHRTAKDGLGRAYLAGFAWALERGYDAVVEMDADGSHPAGQLSDLIEPLREGDADVVVGSRWVEGGSVLDWPAFRQGLSRGGNSYARVMLGIPVQDSTSGFRAYTAAALSTMHLDDVHSRGYCFQIDMALRALDAGARLQEVPIVFRERTEGTSKMGPAIVAEAMLRVTGWGVARRTRSLRGARRTA